MVRSWLLECLGRLDFLFFYASVRLGDPDYALKQWYLA